MELHEKLQILLNDNKMSQADLARKLKTNRSSVNYWITGKYKPRSDVVAKIARIFDVSEAWLIGAQGATRERDGSSTPELNELIRIYKLISVRSKMRLLAYAYELEEAEKNDDNDKLD